MAKCDLTIVIEGEQREFEVGDTVSGYLQVRVDSNCKCDGLTLTQHWGTHGKGNRATGGEQVLKLYRGEWKSGENHSYPFEFKIPEGPVTYHGHYLNVDHYLSAVADIPWALDPKAEEAFIVVPSSKGSSKDTVVAAEGLVVPTLESTAIKLPTALLWVIGLVFFLPGLGIMIGGGISVSNGHMEGIMGLLFGACFSAVACGILFMGLRNSLAEKKLGPVIAQVEPMTTTPGQALSVALDFTPQGELRINTITATLKGTESVISGSGTNTTTYTHVLFEQQVVLRPAARLMPREAQELADTFQLPADAAFSFSASDNSLNWGVEFHIDIAKWPDWTTTVPVFIGPA